MGLTRITSDGITDGTITGTDLATNVDLVDNQKLRLGTGNDLQIWHDASDSNIADVGTGDLNIRGSTVKLLAGTGETFLKGVENAQVELYYNGTKNFETTSSGADITGDLSVSQDLSVTRDVSISRHLDLADDSQLRFGSPNGFNVYHDGNNTYMINQTGNLYISDDSGNVHIRGRTNEESIIAKYDGSVELYYDNSKKFETDANGAEVLGNRLRLSDNVKLACGAGADLQIYHSTANNIIQCDNGMQLHINKSDTENMAKFIPDGAVELYYDNVLRFQTSADGVDVTSGHLTLTDNYRARFGAGLDLQIWHDGSQSYVYNTTGNLNISSGAAITLKTNTSEAAVICNNNGSVDLYHDNSKKLETQTNGITVTGGVYSDGLICGDSEMVELGNSGDLQIFHDGSTSLIKSSSHPLAYYSNTRHHFLNGDGSESMAVFVADGQCELYHNGSKKFETTSSGISVTGAVYSSTGVVGEDAANHFDFVTDNRIAVSINGSEDFRFESDGDFHADGDVIAFSTTVSSDVKLKENIKVVPDALDKVEALRGVTFDWKRDGKSSAGVIAQDVMGVLPEAVKEVQGLNDKESYLSVNYNALTSILVEAIKDLSARIKILEAK